MAFAHLHVHTEYSLLDGSNKIQEYVARVKELGMTAAAITDHGVMYGVIDFYKAANAAGINPILGCEVYVAPNSRFDREKVSGEDRYYHLVLLAENNTGYSNLMKIVSKGFVDGYYYKPRVDMEVLTTYHEGIIALSACLAGEVQRNLVRGMYDEAKKVAEKYHALLTELSKNVKSAHRHGMKPQNDVLKVQVKLNESELSLRKADNALRLASMNLCHYIGRPLTAQIDISDDFPEVEQEWKVQVSDITARPEYGILNKQIAIAEQEVKLNRSELLPRIGVRGSYDYLHGLEVNDETLMKKGAFSVFLNVSVPLFHFGERTNKVKSAKVKLEQARLEQENVNEKMLLELMQAANNLDEARLETELSERSLEQAEENMKVSGKQYEVGLETLSDYLEAQVLWQQAYQTKVDAHFQLYVNYVAYLKAAGQLQ